MPHQLQLEQSQRDQLPSHRPILSRGADLGHGRPSRGQRLGQLSGPQWYSFSPRTNDTFVYIQDNHNGDWGLNSTFLGITWNCPTGGPCIRSNQAPLNVQWTEIHLNHDTLDGQSNGYIQNVATHESGHAMILAHNYADAGSIMYPFANPSIGGPNNNDIGTSPGCANTYGMGLRCIYGSGN
jgi:hypothetical protein